MDPNETYRRIAAAVAEYRRLMDMTTTTRSALVAAIITQTEVIAEGFENLDEWLSKGGFAPSAWDPMTLGKGRV